MATVSSSSRVDRQHGTSPYVATGSLVLRTRELLLARAVTAPGGDDDKNSDGSSSPAVYVEVPRRAPFVLLERERQQ
jgi:hypothetical protein